MKVAVIYVFPQVEAKKYEMMAHRFATQYMSHPPGESDHDLIVCVNGGGQITPRQEKLFDPLVPTFIYHNNVGKDLGAYMMAARNVPCDLLVCIGAPARPRMAGWLDLMVRAVENNGPGVYGCWAFHEPAVHIRTTVFWISPELLTAYPHVIDNSNRYQFEHGPDSIALWCMKRGFPALQVTRRGVFSVEKWHYINHEDSLFADQHMDGQGFVD